MLPWWLERVLGIDVRRPDADALPRPLLKTRRRSLEAHPDGVVSAALARLQAVDFKRLVPGHGPVMDKATFGTYRLAFDKLLQCAASKAEAATCRDGWITDAAPLLQDDEQRKLAGMLLDYYLDAVLRDEKKQARFCPTDPTAQARAIKAQVARIKTLRAA